MPKHKIGILDFDPLVNLLPGARKCFLDITALSHNELLDTLSSLDTAFDSMILSTVDHWHNYEQEQEIFDHPVLKDKLVFLQTQTYQNQYLGHNCWRLSYPSWYLNRHSQYRQSPGLREFRIKPKQLPRGFGCLNNRPALHRLLLGTALNNRGLLDQMIFTQNNTQAMCHTNPVYPAGCIDPQCNEDPGILDSVLGWYEYLRLLPIKWQNQAIQNQHCVYHDAEINTYCNILTEATTGRIPYNLDINLPEISEKSHKPFVSGQIPLYLAARGHTAYLQGIGFEVMSDLTPAGFDDLGTLDRIQAIVDVVARGRDWIENFYYDHIKEIQHNHELVFAHKTDQIILQRIQEVVA